jgi:hypothetical protein
MTQPLIQQVSTAERVAAALQVYADAIRLGQTPTPNFITLHTAALPHRTFMALADQTGNRIEILNSAIPYARLELPFGAGILPTGITASVHATCSITSEAMRADIVTHNAECVTDKEA